MRYSWVRISEKTKELKEAQEELNEIPTTPGDMMWVPCVCQTEPPIGTCEVCTGYGKMLTLIIPEPGKEKLV